MLNNNAVAKYLGHGVTYAMNNSKGNLSSGHTVEENYVLLQSSQITHARVNRKAAASDLCGDTRSLCV